MPMRPDPVGQQGVPLGKGVGGCVGVGKRLGMEKKGVGVRGKCVCVCGCHRAGGPLPKKVVKMGKKKRKKNEKRKMGRMG